MFMQVLIINYYIKNNYETMLRYNLFDLIKIQKIKNNNFFLLNKHMEKISIKFY